MDQKEIDLKQLIRVLWNQKFRIIRFVFIVTALSIVISLLLPKWYKSQTVLLSPSSSMSSLNPLNMLGELGIGSIMGSNEESFRYLAILKSRSLRENVIDKFDLKAHYKSDDLESALETFDKNIHFEIGDEFQIIISMIDKNQEIVADITNYIVECMDSLNIELSILNAKNNRMFMGERVNEITDSLNIAGDELKKFMEKNGIIHLENQVIAGVEQASLLKATIIQKEVELEVARKSFSSNNPIINQLELELSSLNLKYKDITNDGSLESLIPSFSQIPDLQLDQIKLQSKIEYYSRLLEYLGPLYEQQKIEEAKNIPTIQVLDEAVRPEKKHKPKRSRIVILTFILASFASGIYYIIKDDF